MNFFLIFIIAIISIQASASSQQSICKTTQGLLKVNVTQNSHTENFNVYITTEIGEVVFNNPTSEITSSYDGQPTIFLNFGPYNMNFTSKDSVLEALVDGYLILEDSFLELRLEAWSLGSRSSKLLDITTQISCSEQ